MGCERGGSDFRGTGIAGVVLFTTLFAIALLGSIRSFTEKDQARTGWFSKKNYFIAVTLMAFLDLFRYYMMAIDDAYKCSAKTWVYGLHMFSNVAFFFSYSVICSIWQDTVGANASMFFFRKSFLLLMNCLFMVITIIGFGFCVSSDTIFEFFNNNYYTFYTIFSAVKNLVFYAAIFWSGNEIMRPLRNVQDLAERSDETEEEGCRKGRFRAIMRKLQAILCVVFLSAVLRVIMLIIKFAILHGGAHVSWYTGPIWWLLSDFIPRLLPTYAFMFIMFGSVLRANRSSKLQQHGVSDKDDKEISGRNS
mmetsp:Transcript_30824/g.42947  ORF Transcript_30824/g.42947 Transcript_30824/m.42947 type:complete len:307 (+) Transcript_30824:45-965(+)|eukprot:CAMPEP_0185257476 /NCGR_PEP_ID=MMETSP1359-20130426/6539_1 /TAXON_ID=552665 /ORGANISM="Bigelowiella longifila, Strain CCMP242" /LENGTH=306 /DNA_ID=CAMNT_0027842591 /DNA_START=24 /DNA_END=944 /DNA_ORIENTATION=+